VEARLKHNGSEMGGGGVFLIFLVSEKEEP